MATKRRKLAMSKPEHVVGIDLGTTNSVAAVHVGGEVVIIPNRLGYSTTPSVVHIAADGSVRIGNSAVARKITDPMRCLFGVKRFIGRKYNEVFDLAERMPYETVIDTNNFAAFAIEGCQYLPQVVSALILKSLKESAEDYLGKAVQSVVITVPAYFTDSQSAATIDAARLAGLSVRRLIREPTAAAMACLMRKDRDAKVAVVDLGGGTLDVSILEAVNVDGELQFEVLSVAGDGFLGGDDFDERLMHWLLDGAQYESDSPLLRDTKTQGRFLDAAIELKHELSSRLHAHCHLRHLPTTDGTFFDFTTTISRELLNELCSDLFERVRIPCEEALKASKLSAKDIQEVLVVGGASLMPKIREVAHYVFGKTPRTPANPFEAIARGAALQGAVLSKSLNDVLLLDATSHRLSIEDAEGNAVGLVDANTTIPTKASLNFKLATPTTTSAEINVLEGHGKTASENRSLTRLILQGLPTLQNNGAEVEVKVSIDIDANSVVSVEARETGTDVTENRVARFYSTLSPEEFESAAQQVDLLWRRASEATQL
jgi:molecular chaperone DnaK